MQVSIREKLKHYLVHRDGQEVCENPFDLVTQVIPEIFAIVEYGWDHI